MDVIEGRIFDVFEEPAIAVGDFPFERGLQGGERFDYGGDFGAATAFGVEFMQHEVESCGRFGDFVVEFSGVVFGC